MSLTYEEWVFLIIWIINFLIALCYLLLGFFVVLPAQERKHRKTGGEPLHDRRLTYTLRVWVMVLCPVVGPLFFLLSYLLYRLLVWTQPDLADVVFSKDRVKTQLRADEERERDMVPLEEAISVNEKRDLRQVMLNTIRGDVRESLASIAMALNIEDTESSHYAASILSDALNAFRVNVQKMAKELAEEDEGSTEVESAMIDYMDSVLKQRVFTDLEQRRMVGVLEEAAEAFYRKDPGGISEKQYEGVCLRLLEAEEYDQCQEWCLRLSERYPDRLEAFTCRLKLYFTIQNREAFLETLKALRASDVLVDNETLELIRIFS